MNISDKELRHRFTPQPGTDAGEPGMVRGHTIRKACLEVAHVICDYTPNGREQALAITKLEEAMFWANKALTRDLDDAQGGAS